MLEVNNILFSYKNAEILSGISFKMKDGRVYSVIGKNGSGKTTLAKLLANIFSPKSGSIVFNGKNICQYSPLELAKFRAYAEQEQMLAFNYTVKEVIELSQFANQNANAVKSAVELMQVKSLLQRSYPTLSGGEKKRVDIARCIAQIYSENMSGKLLILDEPAANLDPYYSLLIMKAAKTLAKKGAIIFAVMHDINLACLYSDRVLALKDKSLFFDKAACDIIDKNLLQNLYDSQCEIADLNGKKLAFFA